MDNVYTFQIHFNMDIYLACLQNIVKNKFTTEYFPSQVVTVTEVSTLTHRDRECRSRPLERQGGPQPTQKLKYQIYIEYFSGKSQIRFPRVHFPGGDFQYGFAG